MKKILLIVVLSFCAITSVSANNLYNVSINVSIDENGNGNVTEVWRLNATEGTEIYHPFGALKDRNITNFTASMDGKDYTYVGKWDINSSLKDKQYKNGINYTDNGLELCMGIEYRFHTYIFNYTIENLVWQYDDNQILYFTFLPKNMNISPDNFKLTVQNKNDLKDIKYSSYGFNSINNIEYNQISFVSEGPLSSDEYVVALIGFPNGTFNNLITKSGTYNDIAKEALDGATLNKKTNIWRIIFWILVISLSVFKIIFKIKSQDKYDKTNFVIPKDVNNFRDIPFNKDFMLAYFIAEKEKLFKENQLIGTFLLKWIKNKNIEVITLSDKKNDYYLDITSLTTFIDETENALARFLKNASKDNKLTPKQFKKWCTQNRKEVQQWLKDAKINSRKKLIENGYITVKEEKKKNIYCYNNNLSNEFIKLKGLKQFLEDMTIIDEKKVIEVHIWDEYLIFAQMFGIADKVAQQFKDFYPVEYEKNNYYCNAYLISSLGISSYSSIISATSFGGSFSGGGMSSGGFSSGGGVR